MKTPYKNIYDVLRLNRFIVLSLIIGAVLTCVVSMFLVVRFHGEAMDSAFVVNGEGRVIPLKMVSQKENLKVEALAHLELFHGWFYGLDAGNYEKNMEKALWLGDGSVDDLYRQKRAEGLYNRLLQFSLVQKVLAVESQVDLDREPYVFDTKVLFEINRGTVKDTYELLTTGKLIHVERNFPNNTHGLLITDFFEVSLQKLEHYESREE